MQSGAPPAQRTIVMSDALFAHNIHKDLFSVTFLLNTFSHVIKIIVLNKIQRKENIKIII